MSRLAPGKADKLIAQFEAAVLDHGDLGAIPLSSSDPEEDRAINATRRRIRGTYTRTKLRLRRALEAE